MRQSATLGDSIDNKNLNEANQTGILFSHSGMRYPSQLLFEEVYRKQVMYRLLELQSFGTYSNTGANE